jgi:hypothetical protein
MCTTGPAIDRAKRICDGCPVRARCLDWALSHGAAFGIWGGRTEAERQAMGAASTQPVRRAWRWLTARPWWRQAALPGAAGGT